MYESGAKRGIESWGVREGKIKCKMRSIEEW